MGAADTYLLQAVCLADLGLVRRALQARACVDAKNWHGQTALHLAIVPGRDATPIVDLLLKAGANPNAQDRQGWTPLHRAALYDHEAVRWLLRAGADATLRNRQGKSALDLAENPGIRALLAAHALERRLASVSVQPQDSLGVAL